MDIGTEKEEKDNSKTAQVFCFGWLGRGQRVRRSCSETGCLSAFVVQWTEGQKRSTVRYCSSFSSSGFETGVCYVAQAGLEPMTLPLQSPDCWDNRCLPTCLDCCCVIWKKKKKKIKIKIKSLPFHYRPIWKRTTPHDDGGETPFWGYNEVAINGCIYTAWGMNRGTSPHSHQ